LLWTAASPFLKGQLTIFQRQRCYWRVVEARLMRYPMMFEVTVCAFVAV
jgi:hypothetical protein